VNSERTRTRTASKSKLVRTPIATSFLKDKVKHSPEVSSIDKLLVRAYNDSQYKHYKHKAGARGKKKNKKRHSTNNTHIPHPLSLSVN